MQPANFRQTFWHNDDGQDLVEYSLLLSFIAISALALILTTKTSINGLWDNISQALSSSVTAAAS